MPPVEYRILAINPGSTSTKFGVFAGSQAVLVRNLRHSEGEMAPFRAGRSSTRRSSGARRWSVSSSRPARIRPASMRWRDEEGCWDRCAAGRIG